MAPVLQAIAMTENRAPKGGGVNSQSSVAANAQATGSEETYEFGLQASYEVDLWGKNRALVSSARATALASIFDREVVAMTLTADVANAYFQYLALRDRLVVAKQNVDNMRQVLAIVAKRAEVGEGKELEVAQQRSALAQAETVVPVLELGRDQAFNRLALLVGRTAETLHLTGTTLTGLKAPVVAPGLPSDLLRRRPDIRRADAVLFGANDMIGNAKAQLWPSLNLTALGGVGSNVLAVALSPQGVLYALAANAAQTLFDDGKTANQIAYSEAHYREMAMAYEKAVLVALQDVNNALVETHWSAVQMEAQARSAEFARRSHEMARRAFQIGTSDYFSVLDSDRTRYAEEDKQVEAKLNQLNASIDLFKALGGGFDAADVPPLDQKAKAEASGTAATPAARPAS
jgi:NodT family efflux transporter outer membrane factor (OMF) lipoprotein